MPVIKIIEINNLEIFRKKLISSFDENEMKRMWSYFFDSYDIVNVEFHYSNLLWRARKVESGKFYNFESELLAPPPSLTRAGRANEENKPMLYASLTADTALSEINAVEGDVIQMISFKTNDLNRIRCAMFGEILNAHRGVSKISPELTSAFKSIMTKIPPEHIKSYVFMDALVSEIMTDRNASKNNYLHSRVLSKFLKNKIKSIEGIIYPSVIHENSMNLAVNPAIALRKLDIVNTFVAKVKRKYSYGFYDLDIVKIADNVDSSGRFFWKQG